MCGDAEVGWEDAVVISVCVSMLPRSMHNPPQNRCTYAHTLKVPCCGSVVINLSMRFHLSNSLSSLCNRSQSNFGPRAAGRWQGIQLCCLPVLPVPSFEVCRGLQLTVLPYPSLRNTTSTVIGERILSVEWYSPSLLFQTLVHDEALWAILSTALLVYNPPAGV